MAICKAWKYLTKLANVLMKEISKARIITNFMEGVWWNTLSNNKYLIWKELLRYEVFSTLLYSISLVKNLASPSRDFAAAQSGLRSTLLNDQQNIEKQHSYENIPRKSIHYVFGARNENFCSYAQLQVSNFYIEQRNEPEKFGSISVSGQLPTYPSPNPTLTLTCYQ